ncbi:MAG: hypothetical protein VW547_13230 [Alphaproteobacteria bacterium]
MSTREPPILFSGPLVRAVLRDVDPKTQTRRLVVARGVDDIGKWNFLRMQDGYPDGVPRAVFEDGEEPIGIRCPYGAPGDRLWVRETHAQAGTGRVFYRADDGTTAPRWTPAIHMPRALSRIDLEVTAVRVERLQDITEEDARAEGVCRENVPAMLPSIAVLAAQAREVIHGTGHTSADPTVWPVARDYRDLFMLAWTAINGERASWQSNPWVWAIDFKRVRP